jgi:hypothetical protein
MSRVSAGASGGNTAMSEANAAISGVSVDTSAELSTL